MQKQPKNSTVRQIQEMVTDEEVKQNKKDPKTYTKKCLYQHMERNYTSD